MVKLQEPIFKILIIKAIKKLLIILFYLSFITSLSAQKITGHITDSNTGLAIAYVNVGVLGKEIGAISDANGYFQLSITNALDTDTLRFSMVSYLSKDFIVSELKNPGFPKTIKLEEKVFQLKEIVISNQERLPIQLGLKRKYCYPIPLYKKVSSKVAFPQKNYRHEIGTKFQNSKSIALDSIQLNFAECNLDSIRFRINVYVFNNETINNILKEPIYVTLSKKEALNFPIINVSGYHIDIDSDFLITIESYSQIPDGSLYILANFKSKGKMYPTYYRQSSQSSCVSFP